MKVLGARIDTEREIKMKLENVKVGDELLMLYHGKASAKLTVIKTLKRMFHAETEIGIIKTFDYDGYDSSSKWGLYRAVMPDSNEGQTALHDKKVSDARKKISFAVDKVALSTLEKIVDVLEGRA